MKLLTGCLLLSCLFAQGSLSPAMRDAYIAADREYLRTEKAHREAMIALTAAERAMETAARTKAEQEALVRSACAPRQFDEIKVACR